MRFHGQTEVSWTDGPDSLESRKSTRGGMGDGLIRAIVLQHANKLRRSEAVPRFPLSLPYKFSKPFFYHGNALVIQDESRKRIKEPRFTE